MIRVALGTIHVGVHLITSHKPEQILGGLLAVRHAIITFDHTTVLRVGVIVDAHLPQLIFLSVKHLLKRSQTAEYGISILAKNDYLSVAVLPC